MAENTKNGTGSGRGGWSYWHIAFFILAIINAFLGLNIALLGPDEPRYAQVGREMLERGDWITPTLGGFLWLEKPALVYWLEILFYRLFGITEFAARLGPALCGIGTIFFLWMIAKIAARSLPDTFRALPVWVSVVAASTGGMIAFSHGISFDLVVTFTITASLLGYFAFDHAEVGSSQRYSSLFAFYFFIGAGLLAKGLIGSVFPFGIVALYHLSSRRRPRPGFVVSLTWGLPVIAAVAALWYWPMYARHGWRFVDEFIIQQHFERFTSNKYQHPQPIYFFLIVLPLMTIPWLPAFFGACWRVVRGIGKRAGTGDAFSLRNSTILFSLVWLLVPLAFFSLSGSKLPGYVLPSLPPAIILASIFLTDKIRDGRGWKMMTMATAFATLIVSICAILFFLPKYAPTDTAKFLIEAANGRGYSGDRVTGIMVVSHSAEFYAAGRLLRTADGPQKQFYCVEDLAMEMKASDIKRLLVFVPNAHLAEVVDSPAARSQLISTSGDLSIVSVSIE
ncbi:MAG: glycosyltransferase family 39 protein [Acidobacteria bacterium]|nr:glycosyltransferase family 39 protein [Acidobacteriota bacterium]